MTLALFRAATHCCFRISRSSEGLKSFTRKTLPIILVWSTTLCLVGFNLRNVKAEAPSKREKEILPSRVVEAKSEKLSSTDPSNDHPFPWIKFLGYITPHFHYLICAVSLRNCCRLLQHQNTSITWRHCECGVIIHIRDCFVRDET
ncbi:unnamed protein product [Lepeophtheirus salmonis]|uniref:(salmon louse) hypothetical protein n=1 Tax=Lepeophtheirus salmonis TaxID=72036 RepID=A0A7R8CG98_LEPSM|nr:unnamed protein product [Lepeophtheirus salmonis]CAF2813646.1 unnamed protein product [Lepeophtheirus salmonis]